MPFGNGKEVGLIPGNCVRGGPSSAPQKWGGPPPQFSAHVHCGQTAGWVKMTLCTEVGLGPGHIMLDGDPAPAPRKGIEPPIFGPSLLWLNGWMHQDATWCGGRPQPRRLCVRWGLSPLPQKWRSPTRFSAHVYCGQTAAWIKNQDATWCGGRPQPMRHCVRCGPSYPQIKGYTQPHSIFVPCLLWPNGWMDEDAV